MSARAVLPDELLELCGAYAYQRVREAHRRRMVWICDGARHARARYFSRGIWLPRNPRQIMERRRRRRLEESSSDSDSD